MDRILTFEQFMTITGGLFLAISALILVLPNGLWFFFGAKVVTGADNFFVRAEIPWAVSMGLLCLMLRTKDLSDPEVRPFLIAFFIGCGIAMLLAAYACLSGVINGFGWFGVALFLTLGLLSLYYLRDV